MSDAITPESEASSQAQAKPDEIFEALHGLVVQEMQKGSDKSAIREKLIEAGVDDAHAMDLTNQLHAQIVQQVTQQQFQGSTIIPALIGGILAALAGGVVWGLIVVYTGFEIGYVAWGIGALCGYAVVRLAGGRKGLPLQLVAVLSSALGIIVGKYFIFRHYMVQQLDGARFDTSFFSSDMINLFIQNLSKLLSGFDALWVLFAVMTAWSIPKALGVKIGESDLTESQHYHNP